MDAGLAFELEVMYPTATEIPETLHSAECVDRDGQLGILTDVLASASNAEPRDKCQWQIDGGAEGFRFFTIPGFALGKAPLRVDAYVPEFASRTHPLRQTAELDVAFSASYSKVAHSNAAKVVVTALNEWSKGRIDLESEYRNLPYGSYIVLSNVLEDLSQAQVDFVPNFAVERAWLSIDSLNRMWALPESSWPRVVQWDQLQLVCQLHENISLVRVLSSGGQSGLLIYKSVLQDLQHFYHELKILLSMPPHPNVLAKPLYVVTKRSRFGSKVGVCGMILEYHTGGTLQNALSINLGHSFLHVQRAMAWARQLVSASIHVRDAIGFYANMKLINIVMSPDDKFGTPVLIDFEQRSGWFSWSPPEVHLLGYIEQLAVHSKTTSNRAHYANLMRKLVPEWKQVDIRARYDDPKDGYATAWLTLNDAEKESAQVYMLGKLLWCVFEQAPSISSCITLDTFREPPCDLMFPTFSQTPSKMRKLIQQCTAGAPEWGGQWPPVFRIGSKLHKVNFEHSGTLPIENHVGDVQAACKAWWSAELERAERYVEARIRRVNRDPEQDGDRQILGHAAQRPRMEQLLQALEGLEADQNMSLK